MKRSQVINAFGSPLLCFVVQVWCHPTRCEYERWRSLADEEALPPGERCRATHPPAAVAPLHLQQRDDRVCDNGASTSGGDHVFVRLIVRPHCRYGRETRLLGMERLWGRAAPEAAQCVHVASYIMLVHPTINPLFVRSFDSTAIRVGRAAQLLGADDDSRHHCMHGASYKCGDRGQHCCACGESCHHSCQCLTLYLTHRRARTKCLTRPLGTDAWGAGGY